MTGKSRNQKEASVSLEKVSTIGTQLQRVWKSSSVEKAERVRRICVMEMQVVEKMVP